MRFYKGCCAIITGASSGLGTEFAKQLAPLASTLVLAARRTERLDALKAELEARHPALKVYPCSVDLADEAARVAFAAWLTERNISPDLLINNAGLGDHGDFAGGDWTRLRAMLDVNITALTRLTYLLLPALRRSSRATILNVSSVASFFPLPNAAVYAATKAYVTSLSEALAIELYPHGISVTALCPGPIPTEFFSVAERQDGSSPHLKSLTAFTVTPAKAVRAGLCAAARGRERIVPGALVATAVAVALLIPLVITRRILRTACQ